MSKRKRKQKTGTCALCGAVGVVTREHVPPKCLFLKPRPSNAITVSLCYKCNHSYHLDDEYFRVMVSSALEPSPQQWQLWTQKVVGSSFSRGGGLRARLSNEYDLVQKYAGANTLQFYDGTPVPECMLPFVQGFDMNRINGVLEKIVKCLHFHQFEAVLQGSVSIDTESFEHSWFVLTMVQPTGWVGFNKEFVYRYEEVSPGQYVWWLVFYECHAFSVRVSTTQQTA